MSGVPPLSGFGGRWLFYNAILDQDLKLPLILVFMAGPVSFLYLFRLIHTIFLGQRKDEHKELKEAPFWILLPQMLFVAFLVGFAILPGMALQKVDGYIGTIFGDQPLVWHGREIISAYGNWNPVVIILVIIAIFVTVFLILLGLNHNAQKVKQFNIVFSGERPFKPNTTHFAWNFFAPYRKAMGMIEAPLATSFWTGITDALSGTADFARKAYTGNGQTYAVQGPVLRRCCLSYRHGRCVMSFQWIQITYALLTLFIVINYGMIMTALVRKIAARAGGRHGIPIWQNYIDLFKNFALRSKINHGVMFYLGPVFRLTGGIGAAALCANHLWFRMVSEFFLFRRSDPRSLFRFLRNAGDGTRGW